MTRSERPREFSRVISGGIDWTATVRARSTASPIEGGFVTRPARRFWDIEENRILAWVLRSLTREFDLAAVSAREPDKLRWQGRMELGRQLAERAIRTAWLRPIPAERPTRGSLARLETSRTLFYATTLSQAARLLRRFADAPTPNDVIDLLSKRWFEPSRDWALFELVVLLRVERALATLGRRKRLRLTSERAAFSVIEVAPGRQVRLWYQNWPTQAGDSEVLDAARHYGISAGGSRPDIVIEVALPGRSSGILIECKATRSSEYLGSGLLQMLAYLRDRPALFGRPASAWLVAPHGAPMTSHRPDGRELWVVHADDVASASIAEVSKLLEA